MFTPKDRTANRYFQKRAHYLAVIASSLSTLIVSKGKGLGKNTKSGEKVDGKKGKKERKEKAVETGAGGKVLDEVWSTVMVGWEWVGGDERRAAVVLTVLKSEWECDYSGSGWGLADMFSLSLSLA